MKLLDLYCGAGGSSVGYMYAGFEVVGVDINPQPRFPFEFIQADVLELKPEFLSEFDVVHASPPCQRYSVTANSHPEIDYPDLVPPTRKLLLAGKKPYIIENVPGAPLIAPIKLCGLALGCNVKRHRHFESNLRLEGTKCPNGHPGDWVSVFGHSVLSRGGKRKELGIDQGRDAMGITWMNREELSEAVPPAYTEFIGKQVMQILEEKNGTI